MQPISRISEPFRNPAAAKIEPPGPESATENEQQIFRHTGIDEFSNNSFDSDIQANAQVSDELGAGSRGTEVLILQQRLEDKGHSPGPVDGIFGPQTLAGLQNFQREQLEQLREVRNGAPPAGRDQLNSRIIALEQEIEDQVAGPATQLQLERIERDADAAENESAPVDETAPPSLDEPGLSQLDIPDWDDLGNVTDSVLEGNIGGALEQALNSESDRVDLTLGAHGSLPPGIPGVSVGLEGEFGVGVERVEDGYEVSISSEVAASLGLELNDKLGVEVAAGMRSETIYKFDTVEEAEQAIYDLAITAGNSPLLDQAAELADDATRITNDVIDGIGDLVDSVPFGLGKVLAGYVDDLADGAINSLPDKIGKFGFELDLRPFKDRLTEVDALRASAEKLVGDFNTLQNEAQGNLDAARERTELTGLLRGNVSLGFPLPVDVPGLGLGGEAGVESSVTASFNEDGSITVSAAHTRDLSVEGGLGVSAELATEGGVTVSTTFRPDGEGGYRREGNTQIEFSGDASAVGKVGIGITANIGVGAEFSYTVQAEEVSGDVKRAASEFLQGDFDAALSELGSIEGDLEVQGRAIGGTEYDLGVSLLGASLGTDGEFLVEDRGESQAIEDLSLEEAFAFLTTEVSNSVDSLGAVPA